MRNTPHSPTARQPQPYQAESSSLTISEQQLLKQLSAAEGHSSLRQLSTGLQKNFSQTRHLLAQLKHKGLVEAHTSEPDGSTQIYSLTAAGALSAAQL